MTVAMWQEQYWPEARSVERPAVTTDTVMTQADIEQLREMLGEPKTSAVEVLPDPHTSETVVVPELAPVLTLPQRSEYSQPVEAPKPYVDPDADTIELHIGGNTLISLREATYAARRAQRTSEATLDYVPPSNIRAYPVNSLESLEDTQLLTIAPEPLPVVNDVVKQEMTERLADGHADTYDVMYSPDLVPVYAQLRDLEATPIADAHPEIHKYIVEAFQCEPGQSMLNPKIILETALLIAEHAETTDHDKNQRTIQDYQNKPGMNRYIELECPEEAAIIANPETPLSVMAAMYRRLWTENRNTMYALAAVERLVDENRMDLDSQRVRQEALRLARQTSAAEATQAMTISKTDTTTAKSPATNFTIDIAYDTPVTTPRTASVSPTEIRLPAATPDQHIEEMPVEITEENGQELVDLPYTEDQIDRWFKRFVLADKNMVERIGMRRLSTEEKAKMVVDMLPDILAAVTPEPGKVPKTKLGVDVTLFRRKDRENLRRLQAKLGLNQGNDNKELSNG